MPKRTLTTRPQKDLLLTLDGSPDTFEKHVSNIAWVPSAAQQIEWRGGTPDAIATDSIPGSWSAQFTVAQDWENPDSLCNWMLANEGELVVAAYKPHADGEFTVTATITVVAPQIGGPVNQFNESQVTCASSKPVFTYPTP